MASKRPKKRTRSEAARLGWRRRRARERAERLELERAERTERRVERSERRAIREEGKGGARSAAAKRGWETRRFKAAKAEGLGDRGALLWSETSAKKADSLLDARDAALGVQARLHGRKLNNREVLLRMVEGGDRRWKQFLREASHFGFAPSAARTAWFSPKARKR